MVQTKRVRWSDFRDQRCSLNAQIFMGSFVPLTHSTLRIVVVNGGCAYYRGGQKIWIGSPAKILNIVIFTGKILSMTNVVTTTDFIATRIYFLRGEKVLLDTDLAILYGVQTKVLKQAVRRNRERFPSDFMFELSGDEWTTLRSQFVTLENGRGKYSKYPPFAFTEQGVAMLSGILNSPRAIETNIAIMRTFVALRKWMQSNTELATKIAQLEKKYDQRFKVVFEAIQQLIKHEKQMRPIGFQIGKSTK